MRTNNKYSLRYVGDYYQLDDVKTFVSVYELDKKTIYTVKCPFCGLDMVQTSRDNPNDETLQDPYECDRGHRIALKPVGDREVAWG